MGPHRFDELRLARNLPSPSALGLRILELTRGEEFEQAELVELLRSDPALTGRILQLANAAASGVPVADVHEAAMRLGARTIRSVALGFTLLETRVPGGGAFQADLYWSRALAVAVSAQGLAEDAGLDPVLHFTLGLLSEVGQLALACVHTERYSRVWEDPRAARRAGLMALELREFEIDHVEVSACLLRDWGLPDAFVHALLASAGRLRGGEGDHESAERSGQLLRLAQALGRVLSNDPREPVVSRGVALDELLGVAASLGHDASALLQRAADLGEIWRSWARSTGVRAIGDPLGDLSLALVQARLREPAPVPMVAPAAPLEPDPFAVDLDAPEVESEEGTARPDRVLLVEARAGALGLLEEALESGEYETLQARGHRAALELALHMHPQVVLIESPADPAAALELLRVLRRSTVGRSLHLIVLTGATHEEVSVDLLDAGADDVLVMPATARLVLARVRVGCRNARERARLLDAERSSFRSAAEMGLLGRRLRSAALTDPLTGLPNRRFGMQQLKQEWERSRRSGQPLSVALVDLDHFKTINDGGGHDIGDAVLREVSDTLGESSRAGDMVARVGGEEFLVLVPGGDLETAQVAAERLRRAVEDLPPLHLDEPVALTISVGVATREPWMRGIDDLLRTADQALYRAKAAGRNRVCSGGEEPGPRAVSA